MNKHINTLGALGEMSEAGWDDNQCQGRRQLLQGQQNLSPLHSLPLPDMMSLSSWCPNKCEPKTLPVVLPDPGLPKNHGTPLPSPPVAGLGT